MKRSMGLLASTLLAAGLGVGGSAVAAGPAAAATGPKTVTISAENYQSYTDDRNRDNDKKRDWKKDNKNKHRHADHRRWHKDHYDYYFKDNGKWYRYCEDDRRRD